MLRPPVRLFACSLLCLPVTGCSEESRGPQAEPAAAEGSGASARPDLLLITLDDVGLELLDAYDDVLRADYHVVLPHAPDTPRLDALFASGLRFERFLAYPMCSPARAALMTGRHGFRTGIGSPTNLFHRPPRVGLQPEELCLPEVLGPAGYATAIFGKWHLAAGRDTLMHPIEAAGFDRFEGHLYNVGVPPQTISCDNGPRGYTNWPEISATRAGASEACCTQHQTVETVDDTLRWVAEREQPWFAYVNFQAIHEPLEDPTRTLPADASDRAKGEAMLSFLDLHLGRLLDGVGHPRDDLYVVLLGDNGTAHEVIQGSLGCFGARKSKSSLYHGGVAVPFVIAGGAVPAGSTRALSGVTDVFGTLCDLAGVATPPEAADSLSLAPALQGQPVARRFRYAQEHRPNVFPFEPAQLADWERAVDDGAFKLIRRAGQPDELYDLRADPCEKVDLFPPAAGGDAKAAFERLEAELERLGVG